MKKCLLLFYWACTVCMLYAQDKNTSSFLFDDFQVADTWDMRKVQSFG